MKFHGYATRAMTARDKRYRRVFEKLGYGRADVRSERDQLLDLRRKYETAYGKKPFHGWDAAVLQEKISAKEVVADPVEPAQEF